VGLELLGRAFADAELVSLAYAFEQASGLRRPPASRPRSQGRRTRPPVDDRERYGTGAAEATVRIDYDRVLGALAYDVRVTGVAPSDVYAVVLRQSGADLAGTVVARLSGPGVTAGRGTLALDARWASPSREGAARARARDARQSPGDCGRRRSARRSVTT
jgi:hypothetical protein